MKKQLQSIKEIASYQYFLILLLILIMGILTK